VSLPSPLLPLRLLIDTTGFPPAHFNSVRARGSNSPQVFVSTLAGPPPCGDRFGIFFFPCPPLSPLTDAKESRLAPWIGLFYSRVVFTPCTSLTLLFSPSSSRRSIVPSQDRQRRRFSPFSLCLHPFEAFEIMPAIPPSACSVFW